MSDPITKSRHTWALHRLGVEYTSGLQQAPAYAQWGGIEKIASQGHPWPPSRRNRAAPRDIGGSFSLQRASVMAVGQQVSVQTGMPYLPGYNAYFGQLVPNMYIRTGSLNVVPPVLPTVIPSTTMVAKGTIGWNRLKPTKQEGSLGQAIGELRSLKIPNASDIRNLQAQMKNLKYSNVPKGLPKEAAGAYLGVVFGLLPLVNDIKDLCRNVVNMDKRIQQLARDNGRTVRRRGTFDVSTAETVSHTLGSGQNSFIYPGIHISLWKSGIKSQMWVTDHSETRFWFSGRFRYWIDPARLGYKGIPDRHHYQLMRIAFGADPTDLSLYYNLMPWSWLLDWVVPVGPILENLWNDSLDNLVADYGYVMAHSVRRETAKIESTLFDGTPVGLNAERLTETKQRTYASPYGFGLDASGFNPRQVAVLAALGLQRL